MAYAQYTAKRSLATAHAASTVYTIPLSISEATPSRVTKRFRQESLSGASESLYYHGKATWQIVLAPVPLLLTPPLIEFLESTEDGQIFTFDPYGSPDFPVKTLSVIRLDDGYTAERFAQVGQNGSTDLFRFSFSLRES